MRLLITIISVGLLTALLAAPVAAAPKNTGCGAEASGWRAVTHDAWITATVEAAGPLTDQEEADIRAGLEYYDKNDDGFVCMKSFQPSLVGAWPPGFFLIKDNNAAAGDQK